MLCYAVPCYTVLAVLLVAQDMQLLVGVGQQQHARKVPCEYQTQDAQRQAP